MTEREKIAARIRALLAKTVANGCTEDEAVAAAAKAAEMLARYNMTVDEAEMRESPFTRHRETHDDAVGDRLWKVAAAISELTGARTWNAPIGMPVEITFFGFEHEVQVATYLLEICARSMRLHEAVLRSQMTLLNPVAQRRKIVPFLDGMADRLHDRIKALKPPQPAGTGLVVLHNQLIDAELKKEGIDLNEKRARGSRDVGADYHAGRAAADKVSLNRGLSGAGNTGLRLT